MKYANVQVLVELLMDEKKKSKNSKFKTLNKNAFRLLIKSMIDAYILEEEDA